MGKRTQDVTRHVQSEKRDSGRGDIVWLSSTARALGGLNVHGVVVQNQQPRRPGVQTDSGCDAACAIREAVQWSWCYCVAIVHVHGTRRANRARSGGATRATCDKPAPTNNKVLGLVGARGKCSQ